MAQVTDDKLEAIALKLWDNMYETGFRGKERGRFALTRDQLRRALEVERLHGPTIARLQDRCLRKGLVLIDLDDIFPCVETKVVRKYRRPPKAIFEMIFGDTQEPDVDSSEEDEDDDEGGLR